jgi:hypothetical protein
MTWLASTCQWCRVDFGSIVGRQLHELNCPKKEEELRREREEKKKREEG